MTAPRGAAVLGVAVRGLLLAAATALVAPAAWSQSAATATAVSGTVAVQTPEGTTRLLAQRSALQPGDLVTTQADSFARLRFSDGGEIAVRPNTQMRIESYRFNPDAPQQDSLVVSLLKGGLRSITGLISRRGDRDAYQLRTPTATIGVRGTDYIARLCAEDCAQELAAREAGGRRAIAPALVARVVRVQGEATASTPGGSRRLTVGDPVYRLDRVETAASATLVLAFLDETRLVLLPGSKFSVDEYRYEPQRPGAGSMLLNLTQGGLRALTGLIARARPQAVRVTTPTATVGVRGTGFDVYANLGAVLAVISTAQSKEQRQNESSAGSPDELARAEAEARRQRESIAQGVDEAREKADQAMQRAQSELLMGVIQGALQADAGVSTLAFTWQGRTSMAAGGERRNMGEFDGVGVGGDGRLFELPPELLDRLRNLQAPRPDQFPFDPKLFGELVDPDQDGLFLLVKGGSILVDQSGQRLVLAEGEASFGAPGRTLVKLAFVPPFLEGDRFLGPPVFDPQMCRP